VDESDKLSPHGNRGHDGIGDDDGDHGHGCDQGDDCVSVPEGGSPLSYLILSGLAVIAGILISGKQYRDKRTA
jgi:hypothetical protein